MDRDAELERLRRLADQGDTLAGAALERARRRRGDRDESLLGLILVDPTSEAWASIWEQAPTWDTPTLERVDALLDANWPDAMRPMPRADLRTLHGGRAARATGRITASTMEPTTEPRWRLVRRLEAPDDNRVRFDAVAMHRLANAPELARLTQLVLNDHRIDQLPVGWDLDVLEQLHGFEHLQVLELSGCNVHDSGAHRLAASTNLAGVTRLALARNQLTDRAIALLAAAPVFAGLVRLDLSANAISPVGVQALVDGDVADLADLELGENAIGDEGVAALARGGLGRLKQLGLATTRIGSSAVRTLVGAPWASGLRALDLSGNGLGVVGVASLVDSACFRGLERLHLACTGLRRGALATLANHDTTGIALRELDLSGNPLSVDGLLALLEAPWLPGLERLALGDRRLDPFLAETLADCGRLTSLRRLDVPALTAAGGQQIAVTLVRSANLPLAARLRLLAPMTLNYLRQLASTGLGLTGVARLDEAQLRAAIREALPVAPDDLSASG